MSFAELTTAIFNTLVVASGVLVTAVPIALLLAILIVRTNVYAASWAWLALGSQLVLPLYATVGAWSAGFGTQGWWPLSQAFIVRNQWTGLAAVTFIHSVAAIPSVVLLLSIGLNWRRRSHEEMALVDGGLLLLARRILLPNMGGWLAAAGFWAILPVMTEMVVTNLYQLPTLPEQIYLDISLGTASGSTYAVSVGLCILPLLMLSVLLRRMLPTLSQFAEQTAQHPPERLPLRQWRWPLTILVWCLVLLIVVVPLGNLVLKIGWETSVIDVDSSSVGGGAGGSVQHAWTIRRAARTLVETATMFTAEFQWTATLALASSSAALLVAGALRGLCRRPWLSRSMDLLCLVLIAMPGPLVASLTTQLFLNEPVPGMAWLYDHTLAAPALAQQSRLFPLAWLVVGGILSTISVQLWELAAIDGLSPWARWRRVVWPATWRLWWIAWLMLAATSAGELSTHLLLLPPGVTTLAQRLFEFLHFGMRYQDSGLCLVLVALGWLVAISAWKSVGK